MNGPKEGFATDQIESLEALLKQYLLEQLVRPATVTSYEQSIRVYARETGATLIAEVTRDQVLTWRKTILARARPETWNRYRRHLRALFNFAKKRGWTQHNPFVEVGPARTGINLVKTADLDLIHAAILLLDRTNSPPLQPGWLWSMIIRTLFYTGVRRRQIVEARWGDIDFQKERWLIRAETSKTHRQWYLPLHPRVLQDLRTLHEITRQRLLANPADSRQVFSVPLWYPRYKGAELTDAQVSGFFRRLSEVLGSPLSPHRIRHTIATLLAQHGDIRTLQELLGHTNLSTTMVYVHPDLDRMRKLTDRLPSI